MSKKSWQKLKYQNEKSFKDEIKNIFHHFLRGFNQTNNKFFLEGESLTLSISCNVTSDLKPLKGMKYCIWSHYFLQFRE